MRAAAARGDHYDSRSPINGVNEMKLIHLGGVLLAGLLPLAMPVWAGPVNINTADAPTLAAELNGVPGPIHLLEIKEEIELSPEQIRRIEDVYQRMKRQAIPLGLELIELERKLNNHFADGTMTEKLLNELLGEIADVYKKLRYTHLAAHLETPTIVTPQQIALYNKLRGYSSEDPCENIPEGHDPEMWKKPGPMFQNW